MAGGFVYTGQRSPYRRRRHGVPADGVEAFRHVVCIQNHDQVGNRMLGDRIASLTDFESLKLAAGAMLLSPFLPLLFMGEEYGETAPFLYFIDHSDEALIQAVREGRREEFASFGWQQEAPDPFAPETFERSRPDLSLRKRSPNRELEAFYGELIRLRKTLPALKSPSKRDVEVTALEEKGVLLVRRGAGEALIALNFSTEPAALPLSGWRRILDSAEERWAGPGSPSPDTVAGRSVALFSR